jgi:hypothetical protein
MMYQAGWGAAQVREEIEAEIAAKHHFRFERSEQYPQDDRNRKACHELMLLDRWLKGISKDDERLEEIAALWGQVFSVGEPPKDAEALEIYSKDLQAREWDVLEQPLYDLGFRQPPFDDINDFLQTLIRLAEECLENGPAGRGGL